MNARMRKIKVATAKSPTGILNCLVQAGERNRGLSIIKSRGTAHSNQVRALVLSEEGVTLSDICTALLIHTTKRREGDLSRSRAQIDELRGADERFSAGAVSAPVPTP